MFRILLIEDNEMNQDMLTRRLVKRGYQVEAAIDGLQGLRMAESSMPDLVLLDMTLPVLDGTKVAMQLKAQQRTCKIPLIALTAHAMSADREAALAAGFDEYETKPIDLHRLLEKMERLLSMSAKDTTSHVQECVHGD